MLARLAFAVASLAFATSASAGTPITAKNLAGIFLHSRA